ncbi:MAG: hypothetical protein ACI9F2_000824 [Lysobacterales bacterium]|jgi:hypothetical protein
MAEQQDESYGKKCSESGKAIDRARRYYRNGKYFANKTAFNKWRVKERKKAEEAAAEAAEAKA